MNFTLAEIQFVIALLVGLTSLSGFYLNLKNKAMEQTKTHENEINLLQQQINNMLVKSDFQQKTIDQHEKRLTEHDKQNEAIIRLTEQISTLRKDVSELTEHLVSR